MTDPAGSGNLLFQSEQHPLVPLKFESCESYCLSLIHRKAYSRASEMAENLDVLDLGCNNGYGTMAIAKRCARIIGVDVNAHAIEAAMATNAAGNIEYRVVDGKRLPFGNNMFDLVTSFQVIEHVEFVEPYLREICRVLRNNGKGIITTPNRCIRLEPGMKPWNPFHMREYDAESLGETLRSVFPYVSIEGLFADPVLYKIELDRAARGKAAARRGRTIRTFRALGAAACRVALNGSKAVAPERFVYSLRWAIANTLGINSRHHHDQELANFIARWSLSDLFYRNEDLNAALDLMAICSMSSPR